MKREALKFSMTMFAALALATACTSVVPTQAASVDLGSEGTMLNNGGTLASQWIRSDSSTEIKGPEVAFIGSLPSGADLRGIFAFDLSSFGVGDTINDATLSVFHGNNDVFDGSDGVITSSSLDVSSVTNGTYVNNGASWDNVDQANAVAWGSPGGDFGATLATVSGLDLTAITTDDEVAFNSVALTGAIQAAVTAGDSQVTFMVRSPDLEATTTRNFFVFQGAIASGSGGSIGPNLNVEFTPVPEPVSMALLVLGGVVMAAVRRHKR